jgi:hypothetical protein
MVPRGYQYPDRMRIMATTVSYLEWLRMPEVQDATEEVIDGEIRITPPAK